MKFVLIIWDLGYRVEFLSSFPAKMSRNPELWRASDLTGFAR